MERRRIGLLEVSAVGLGCNNFGWRIGPRESEAVLDAALDGGVNFLDTADMYATGQSEEFIGNVLRGRRKNIVLATKFGFSMGEGKAGARPEYVRQAAEDSLRRLKTEYIDLYLLHTPDPATPIADTLEALDGLVHAGKVREIGCSNFTAAQLREANDAVRNGAARFVNVQNEYSVLQRQAEADVLPECERLGITFTPYFPLANGLLTGKYRKGIPMPDGSRGKDQWGPTVFTEANLEIVESLTRFAAARGRCLLELAFAWLLAKDVVVSVIAGARTPQQARENAAAAGWRLTSDEVSEIDNIVGDLISVSHAK